MPVDVTVFAGTRPEAIKLAPVVLALRGRGVATRLVSTGQHGNLLDDALKVFGLEADANLGAMQPGQSLGGLTARLLQAIGTELEAHRARMVVVQGDTTSAFCGALGAFYAHVPCAHVEAGLRSYDRAAPWPEELNRAMADRLCKRLYAPTAGARKNLLAEGLADADIMVTGQTGVDAALLVARALSKAPRAVLAPHLEERRAKLVFATGHRRENQQGGIARVAGALRDVAARRDDVTVLFAAHPSPEARKGLDAIAPHPHWRVIEPVDYAASLWLLREAACVVTDSGGLQEEAPCFGTPVLVTRSVTERPEGVAPGFLRVVGTEPRRIEAELATVLDDAGLKARLAALPNPYGDGRAAERIADDLCGLLAGGVS